MPCLCLTCSMHFISLTLPYSSNSKSLSQILAQKLLPDYRLANIFKSLTYLFYRTTECPMWKKSSLHHLLQLPLPSFPSCDGPWKTKDVKTQGVLLLKHFHHCFHSQGKEEMSCCQQCLHYSSDHLSTRMCCAVLVRRLLCGVVWLTRPMVPPPVSGQPEGGGVSGVGLLPCVLLTAGTRWWLGPVRPVGSVPRVRHSLLGVCWPPRLRRCGGVKVAGEA